MKNYFERIVLQTAVAISCCGLTGCTCLTVKKVAPESPTPGVRYSLPKPFVQVTPQPDGSVTADIVFLPDADNTYAVDGQSFLSTHTLKVSTANGLLTKLTWNADSSAVVAQGVQSAEAVAQQHQDALNKAAADTKSKIADAQKAVDDAQLAVDTAQTDLAIVLGNGGSGDAILKAKIALNEAQLKLAAAKARLAKLKGTEPDGSAKESSGDQPSRQPETAKKAGSLPGETQVLGPILYAVNERVDKNNRPLVILQATGGRPDLPNELQPSYPTVPLPKSEAKEPDFFPKGVEGIHPDKDGNMQLLIVSSGPVSSIQTNLSKLEGPKKDLPPISIETPTTIRVDLRGYDAGDYNLQLWFTYPPKEKSFERDLVFKIIK